MLYRTFKESPMTDNIQRLKEILSQQSSITFAYLFGSRVKGYANGKSDWDIAVYFSEQSENIVTWPVFEIEATAQVTVLNNSLTPVFYFQIVSEGIVLVDKNEACRAEFENRVLRYYYDWQYFQKRQILAEKSIFKVE